MKNMILDSQLVDDVLDLAVRIQQIPAPTFSEVDRSNFIFDRFQKEKLQDVSQDDIGNVYARYPGTHAAHPIIVSAHLDTVFPQETDLSVNRSIEKIHAPGIGDNAIGVAGLFALGV